MTEPEGTTVVVAPVELDYATAPLLAHHLDAALADGAAVVVADLSMTTFCDSSGLRALVRAAQRAGRSGQRLELRDPPAGLVRIAGIVGASEQLGLSDG